MYTQYTLQRPRLVQTTRDKRMRASGDSAPRVVEEEHVVGRTTPGCDTRRLFLSQALKQAVTSVTVVECPTGARAKRAPSWQLLKAYGPAMNGENIVCTVEATRHGRRVPHRRQLKGVAPNGTSGLSNHEQIKHPELWEKLTVSSLRTQAG